ncbi:MAG TPA: cell division protein FtsL [Ignavibacteria bacterium]|nr:cell division protein FtsL [Ignavibacteria bacterium]HQY51259.1 cell division protein FtsL [Ignavibacteria bacterium]HRA99933.1 cell division protein FtsL [Ignavibacteria bacterium]
MKKPNKKISIFYFLICLIITSVILVIYINNIIQVNQIMVRNNELKEELRKAVQKNEQLLTETEKLTSFDRINSLASEKLELSYKENSTVEAKNITIKNSELK